MKNIKTYTVRKMRMPLPALLIMFAVVNATGQNQTPVYTTNACGFYPSSGTFIQGLSSLTVAKTCTTTITPGSATVYFTARDKVILSPGFTALSGSSFIAYILPVPATGYPPSLSIVTARQKTGIAQSTDGLAGDIFIAPNPFNQSFTLSISTTKYSKASVTIYNLFGVKIKEQKGANLSGGQNNLSFDCSTLASGVYMLEVNFGDSKVMRKIVKGN